MSIFDRKLSDLTVGDVAKGYAVYWGIGAVAALVVAVIGFSMVSSAKDDASSSFGPGGFGGSGGGTMLETSASDHQVTRAEYVAVKTGTSKDAVLERFGDPGGKGSDIYDQTGQGSDDCVYYSRATKPDKGYLFCFDGDEKLTAKHGM
ncbi:hypothetical protein AB0L40_02020 [Patulibacter sp. NPDC049589]|uniref:hypothetical protein n=1 Tax=Patulibacter sp. NPDC049589 TaxID=3154731 RepID=UPI0034157B02